MIATLCSYDRLFGPRHVQTLSLTAQIAQALWAAGDTQSARCLLDRVVRDLARTHATRISALNSLKELALQEADMRKAIAVQTEISECHNLLSGPDAAETSAARSALAELLMPELAARVV
jgi:hypothetical protein